MTLPLSIFSLPWRRWAASIAALAWCGGLALANAGSKLSVPTEVGSGIDIEFEQVLSECPPMGSYPLLLKIHNTSAQRGDWMVNTGSSYGDGVSSETSITLEAGKSASVWIYAPVSTQDYGGGGYRHVELAMHGTGIDGGKWNTFFSHSPQAPGTMRDMDFPGLSARVAGKGEAILQEQFKKDSKGGELDSTRVDLGEEITDWRVFSGLGQLWMAEEEWTALSAGTRMALMDWLALGGKLVLLTTDMSAEHLATLGIPPADGRGSRGIGAGRIVPLRWDGVFFPINEAMIELLDRNGGDSTPKLLGSYHENWELREVVGNFEVHGWLIFGFIVVFGALVGPVNLFYLAGSARRHRLFWTTPLISLAGGTFLTLLMVFQDGIGGSGARRVLAIMVPGQRKTAVVQEQVSRTGVLLGSSFSVAEPVWITPLPLRNPSGFDPEQNMRRQFLVAGDAYRGNWFSSRAVQAQLLEAARPSRGGIEVYAGPSGDGAPSVVSSLATPLRELFVVDEMGRVWVGRDVSTGVKKEMSASSRGEFDAWYEKHCTHELGPLGKKLAGRLRGERGRVFATSDDADAVAVPTLRSVRWNDQGAIFAGPYEKR